MLMKVEKFGFVFFKYNDFLFELSLNLQYDNNKFLVQWSTPTQKVS
jgi:hypothetical protein